MRALGRSRARRKPSYRQPGPYESSLPGKPVADPEKPFEVLCTVHSFDPCMACTCHTFDPSGKPIATVKDTVTPHILIAGIGNILLQDDGLHSPSQASRASSSPLI